jgi:glycolate dehydrogenase FAD-linked subunit
MIPTPAARKTLLATYEQMDAAAATVSAIIAAKIIPCTMEFLDRTTIRCIENYSKVGLPTDCEAILLLESDGHPAAVEEEAGRMARIAQEHGARSVALAKDAEEATKLMTARRMDIPAMARVAPTTILEDATVPRSKLPEMVRFVQKTAAKYRLTVGTFGHFGDGNLHPTFLANERNEEEIHRVHEAVTDIFAYAVGLGGTISGEHGIGLTKKAFLPGAIGEINELPESTWCCGSAGIYNLIQPEMSERLLSRKLGNIARTGASVVATANPGCHLQLENGAKAKGAKFKVVHPASLLAAAYRAERGSG